MNRVTLILQSILCAFDFHKFHTYSYRSTAYTTRTTTVETCKACTFKKETTHE